MPCLSQALSGPSLTSSLRAVAGSLAWEGDAEAQNQGVPLLFALLTRCGPTGHPPPPRQACFPTWMPAAPTALRSFHSVL